MSIGRSVGVGVVGYGLAGRYFHAPFIAAVDGLELVAIATAQPDRVAAARREHPAATIVASFDELLARPDVEVVIIAAPNLTHEPLGVRALDAGRHVVVDKPIAPDVAAAERLIDAASRAGRTLSVYQNRRWDGDFLTVRGLVGSGALGPIDSLESRFEIRVPPNSAWREDVEQRGGPHRDLGAHLVDQSLLLFGPARRVYAEMDRRRAGTGVDDAVFVSIEHDGPIRSRIWTSLVASWGFPRYRLRGLLGEFVKDGRDPQEAQSLAGGRPTDAGFGEEPVELWGTLHAGEDPPRRVPTERGDYRRFYEGLRDAIRDGGPPPVDPVDAVAGLRVLDAAERAARMGTTVDLGPV